MKTPIAITLATVALATANAASAYHWSPPDASVHLHGKLTFTPNEGGKPFTCSVTMELKTKRSYIATVKFPRGDCKGVRFVDGYPWRVNIANQTGGFIGGGSFESASGGCVENDSQFQVNGSGIWTLPAGQCLSGTLTSHPPTTIVP